MRWNRWKGTIMMAAAALSFAAVGCGSSVQGTYSNSTTGQAGVTLELRSGGKASFSTLGQTQPCTYKESGKTIHLTCGTLKMDFHVMDDGSLTSNSFLLGSLRKAK